MLRPSPRNRQAAARRSPPFAPTSSTTLCPRLVGQRAAIAGRSMPSMVPSWNMLIAISAPVLPAEIATCASPFSTDSMARHMDVLRPRRSAMAGLFFHAHAFRRVADLDARGELAAPRQQRLQHRLVAMHQEIHIGMADRRTRQSRHDNGRAGIAAHGIDRNVEGSAHLRLAAGRSRISLPSSPLRGRHSGRRNRRRDEGASARRSSGTRHGRSAQGDDGPGAYSAWTARFFVWGPPWRELLQGRSQNEARR